MVEMFKALFDIIIGLLASLVQIVCIPINSIITSALPDLSERIVMVSTNIVKYFSGVGYILSYFPPIFSNILLFIVSLEVVKFTIWMSTHTIVKLWNLFQKLKFW